MLPLFLWITSMTKRGESRNVLVEAARLSRGEISPLEDLKVGDWDALVLPGGYGAALQLSSWAKEGASCRMNASLERIIKEFYQAQKPIAAICISPVLLAKALGGKKITVTIGSEASTAEEIQKTGALHENCEVTDYVTDRENRVITTPAYMCAAKPHEVFEGISKAMKELAALC